MSGASRPLALALGGLIALAAGMGIGRFLYTPILPWMVEALGLSRGQAGLIASANYGGYLAGALVAATPLIAGSRRAWFLGALAASALSTAAMALVSSIAGFLLLRFVGGVASAFVLVFASALVLERLAGDARPWLSSLYFGGVGVGIAFSALMVAGLAALGQDWRALWLGGGIAAFAALAFVPALVPNRAELPLPPAPERGALERALVALVIAYGLFGFGYVITATFIIDIVRASPESRALETTVWLVVGLAGIPSVWGWTRAAQRVGIYRAFALACWTLAAGVVASVLWHTGAGLLFAGALLGGTIMGITALGLMGARRLARGDPRRMLALITASFSLGQIAGPYFAGVMHDATGSFLAPSLIAAGGLIFGGLLVLRSGARD